MRIAFVPPNDKVWLQFYQRGGNDFPLYVGQPYQRGSGLGSIFKGLLKFLLPVATKAGKAIGKQALVSGAQLASDIAGGETLKTAAKRRGKQAAGDLLSKAATHMKGGRLGVRPKKYKRTAAKVKVTKKGRKPRTKTDIFGK